MVHHDAHAALEEGQLVVVVHGAGAVNEEYQIGGWEIGGGNFLGREGYAEQQVFTVPGRGADGEVCIYRMFGCRGGIVIIEVIEHFLNSDRILGGHFIVLHEVAAQVGVAGCVYIDGECRNRIVQSLEKGIVDNTVVFFGVEIGGKLTRVAGRGIGDESPSFGRTDKSHARISFDRHAVHCSGESCRRGCGLYGIHRSIFTGTTCKHSQDNKAESDDPVEAKL